MKAHAKIIAPWLTLGLICLALSATAGTIEITTGDGVLHKHQYESQRTTTNADQAARFQNLVAKAENGDAESQARLASYYDRGSLGTKDVHEAAKWFLRAANQGHVMAQLWLAGRCYQGQGVPQDFAESYKWAALAASQNGNSLMAWNLSDQTAKSLLNRFTLSMTPQTIAEGQRRAAAFVAKMELAPSVDEHAFPKPRNVEGMMATGTGFFVTDDGYLVTCAHVVNGLHTFHVKTANGLIPARLVSKDSDIDIALLKVDGTYAALPIAPNPRMNLGDSVFTIGFPNTDMQGEKPKYTRGEISSLDGIHDDPNFYQISVPTQHGNSGGALVDEQGNVVGVIAAILDDVKAYEATGSLPQNVNYAVKGTLVYHFISGLPEVSSKLKLPRTIKNQGAANSAAERASVLVIAE